MAGGDPDERSGTDPLRVMIDLADDRLTVDAVATLMGLGRRQIYRLRRAFSADGPAGLASRKRGRRGLVLAVLAMLAPKWALRVAPGGSAPPIPSAARRVAAVVRPGRESRRLNRTGKLPPAGDRVSVLLCAS